MNNKSGYRNYDFSVIENGMYYDLVIYRNDEIVVERRFDFTEEREAHSWAIDYIDKHIISENLDYKAMYEQMERLAYDLFITLLDTPDEVWKNGNTNDTGHIDEGLVLHSRFIQQAADILGIDLTKPIELRK